MLSGDRATRSRPRTRLRLLAVALGAVLLAAPQSAAASWVQEGSGSAAAGATSVPAGNRPTADKPTLSSTVTVTWTATTVLGRAVTGYVVNRYSGTTLDPVTSGTCTGGTVTGSSVPRVVTTLSCTDQRSIFDGASYTYRVRPVLGNWVGPESPASPAV